MAVAWRRSDTSASSSATRAARSIPLVIGEVYASVRASRASKDRMARPRVEAGRLDVSARRPAASGGSGPPVGPGRMVMKRLAPLMILTSVLTTLWHMLDAKRRVVFVILVISLFVAGIFEMAGMLVIFGFISGLKPHPETDHRAGVVSRGLHLFADQPLTDTEYAIWGGLFVVAVIVLKNVQS